jgi:hypothetical protein
MWRFKELKRGVINIWKWLPIIWRDRDWDHFYIYQILEFKLRKQANYISTMDRHTRAQEDARNMLICANLIAKVKDGYYEDEYVGYYESKFNFIPIDDKPGFSELEIDVISEDFDSYFKKYPTWHKRAINHIEKNKDKFTKDKNDIIFVAMIMSQLRQEKAKELVFKIISDKIEYWWD